MRRNLILKDAKAGNLYQAEVEFKDDRVIIRYWMWKVEITRESARQAFDVLGKLFDEPTGD